jgi:hypothetical protein
MTGMWARHPVTVKVLVGGLSLFLVAKGLGQ